jgi:hypothetical protein
MNITRRSVLKCALVAAAAVLGTSRTRPEPGALLVFDSRLPQSLALQRSHAGRSIDLAHEHANLWGDLRRLRSSGNVVGLTRWSDLVQVRGLLEERGSRLRAQARCGRLFYWEMTGPSRDNRVPGHRIRR